MRNQGLSRAVAVVALAAGLAGCTVYQPAYQQPAYYQPPAQSYYAPPAYYAPPPAYYAPAPAYYAAPSVSLGFGFWGGGGRWHGHHDR